MKLQRIQTVFVFFSLIQLSIQIKKDKNENTIKSNLLKNDKTPQLSVSLLEKESESGGMQMSKGKLKSKSEGKRIGGRKTRRQGRLAKTRKTYRKSKTNR